MGWMGRANEANLEVRVVLQKRADAKLNQASGSEKEEKVTGETETEKEKGFWRQAECQG